MHAQPPPDVSVVVATHNRAGRLEAALQGLRRQTLEPERFEVIVVDDGSRDRTPELLARASRSPRPRIQVITHPANLGRAAARESGWRAARAALVAFTDDDCVPDPQWLAAGLSACRANPGAIIQGITAPICEEWQAAGRLGRLFSRTIQVLEPDAGFATCNVFYPRDLLARVDGFDTAAFGRVHGGEDADLAWRAIEAGAPTAFAPAARVAHAVNYLGPLGRLRIAARFEMKAYARHPGLRHAHFFRGPFWKLSHYLLLRALAAMLLRGRVRLLLGPWLAGPYVRLLVERVSRDRVSPLAMPYLALVDMVEVAAVARASVRNRTPMI